MTMPESRVERDRELRNWRPEFEVEPEMSPAKRQKMDATSSLYRKLVGHVLTVMQEREERDTRERAKSKDIAGRYPLTFMDDAIDRTRPDQAVGNRECSPEESRNVSSAKATPVLQAATKQHEWTGAMPGLTLDDDAEMTVKKADCGKRRHVSLPTLEKVWSSEDVASLDILDMHTLPIF